MLTEEAKVKKRAFYYANRDRILRDKRAYRLAHPEKDRQCWEKNRDLVNAKSRRRYAENLEQSREVDRQFRNSHRSYLREYFRKYREANRSKIREYGRANRKCYYYRHRERLLLEGRSEGNRKYQRSLYRKNLVKSRVQGRVRSKKYYWSHRELCILDARSRYLLNRTELLEKAKQWRKSFPDKKEFYARFRKALGVVTKRKIESTIATNKAIYGVLTCYLCAKPMGSEKLNIEHKVPVSRGGSHDESNLGVAHWRCNKAKGVMTADEWFAKDGVLRVIV